MAEVYTRRITDWNLNGPLTQLVFRTPESGTYVLRHLVWTPTSGTGYVGIYVSNQAGSILFHLARTNTGNGTTAWVDLRQELLPGDTVTVSLPQAGQAVSGALTAYVFE